MYSLPPVFYFIFGTTSVQPWNSLQTTDDCIKTESGEATGGHHCNFLGSRFGISGSDGLKGVKLCTPVYILPTIPDCDNIHEGTKMYGNGETTQMGEIKENLKRVDLITG